ncbi:Glycosyltransferase involved in cell wall bisynthesis [Butyrivibrio hungatei DSM 14810]|uniref:Glycosyltransferase involved in cell wall bisynthesis n=1 Tax=Butyrivibrio hungatei DSM 14810 TaxID=1121132 RepID=A0A1M7T560_9FIRM|nr:glycosyltransferase family 2 protein [Butyrivibrio hungatei]SHN65802.1 Glycosyltransferase involved in cell wall bisynthesis [Butyrivibrio hungatei DSM 14810]
MMANDTLYIVMPAYNEVENIESVINQWYPIIEEKNEKSKIIVADSGSNDGTHELLERMSLDHSKLAVLSDTGKFHGPKLMALYRFAIEDGAEYVFQTDSDGQTSPDEFEMFWNERANFDAIIGYRSERGDGKGRAFVEKVVCILVRIFFGVKVPDANAPFRLMKGDALKKYIDKLPEDFNIPNIMFTVYFSYYGEKTKFLPISFKSRQAGKNSIDLVKIVKIGWKALKDFRMLRTKM